MHKAASELGVRVAPTQLRKMVEAYTKANQARQLLQRRPPWKPGHVAAEHRNDRWDIDVIDYSANPSGEFKYILFVQDIHTRKIFATALKNKKPETESQALAEMFEAHGVPRVMHGDAEFEQGAVAKMMQKKGVAFTRQAKGDYNQTATLASAIRQLREDLARRMLSRNTREWQPLLAAAVNGQNDLSRPHLMNHSANDAWEASAKDPTLEFQLRVQAAQQREDNTELRDQRAGRLRRDGGFRVPEGQTKTGFRRGFKPIWSGKVHRVVEITEDGQVKDEDGKYYPTRMVLPVPLDSADVDVEAAVRSRGSAALDAARTARFEQFKEPIRAFIDARGGETQLSLVSKYARNELGMVFPAQRPSPSEIMRLLGFETRLDRGTTYVRIPDSRKQRSLRISVK